MKKLVILTMVFGALSMNVSARDYDYNEMRDILAPMNENNERINRLSPSEIQIEDRWTRKNLEIYKEFHRELERSHIGKNTGR